MERLEGWEILEASWMSPFGLAISGVLFIAGHFVTDGILEYRRGQDLVIFKDELDTLHRKATDIDQFFLLLMKLLLNYLKIFRSSMKPQHNNSLIVKGRFLIQMIGLILLKIVYRNYLVRLRV